MQCRGKYDCVLQVDQKTFGKPFFDGCTRRPRRPSGRKLKTVRLPKSSWFGRPSVGVARWDIHISNITQKSKSPRRVPPETPVPDFWTLGLMNFRNPWTLELLDLDLDSWILNSWNFSILDRHDFWTCGFAESWILELSDYLSLGFSFLFNVWSIGLWKFLTLDSCTFEFLYC